MVYEKVRSMLARQLEIPEETIFPETNIVTDLGADSLDVVELIMSLEEAYDIVITDEAVSDLYTVQEVTDFITQQIS